MIRPKGVLCCKTVLHCNKSLHRLEGHNKNLVTTVKIGSCTESRKLRQQQEVAGLGGVVERLASFLYTCAHVQSSCGI